MHIINLRMREVRKLMELPIESGVLNTEALMLVLKRRSFPDHVERVFKYLDAQEDPVVMSKKLFTVTALNTPNSYQEISELIIPDSIIYVDRSIAGFAMPIVPSHRNLGPIINNPQIPLSTKMFYLQQMGNIIDRVQRVEEVSHRFQFGDLNEFNFIIDADNQLKAIDLDSAYLGVGDPLGMAYYLLKNPYIQSLPEKYKSTAEGVIIPSDNTDLYCYNMILLNAMSKENIYRHSMDTYYRYLDYIHTLGLPDELLESFYLIYIPKDNVNPRNVLEDIDPSLEPYLDFKTFQKRMGK